MLQTDDYAYVDVASLVTKLQMQSLIQAKTTILCHVVDLWSALRATQTKDQRRFINPKWIHDPKT